MLSGIEVQRTNPAILDIPAYHKVPLPLNQQSRFQLRLQCKSKIFSFSAQQSTNHRGDIEKFSAAQ